MVASCLFFDYWYHEIKLSNYRIILFLSVNTKVKTISESKDGQNAKHKTTAMSDNKVPPIKPAGSDLTAGVSISDKLAPLEKLSPRQQEKSGQAATTKDTAVAATATELTSTTTTTATATATATTTTQKKKKKKRPTLSVKFDPESAVNYKSPFMFGTPKATTTPKA